MMNVCLGLKRGLITSKKLSITTMIDTSETCTRTDHKIDMQRSPEGRSVRTYRVASCMNRPSISVYPAH